MIGYVTLGTNDLARAAAFYDALLAEIGAKRLMETDRYIFWGAGMGQPALSLIKPFDGKPATVGNGTMVSLVTDNKDKVNAVYQKAMSLGCKDEGAPGPRGEGGFYGAYFRDLEGNKLAAFCIVAG
jgi:catechol 2,3-dioxygenase-like lactoylglutathione lyase family enzyme